MSDFEVINLPLQGLKLIKNNKNCDKRGYISRIFCKDQLSKHGWNNQIFQVNHSMTYEIGTVRGMHLQKSPYAEMKIVRCIRGEIWDVVVDLRKNSPTFLQWHAENLSEENRNSLMIPQGFAHGFQSLTKSVELLYFHSSIYKKEFEMGFNPEDPKLGISWPLPISILSERDKSHLLIDDNFKGIKF